MKAQKKTWTTAWAIVGRGLNGWHAKAANISSSGGTLADYLAAAADGATVYDAEEADRGAFVELVYRGPIVDPSLPWDGWDKFGHDEARPKALDTVGVGRYRAILATVPGLKLGRVQAGRIEWDDVQPALPGAEDVRAQEVTVPTFDLPAQTFELTSPAESEHVQPSIFGGVR